MHVKQLLHCTVLSLLLFALLYTPKPIYAVGQGGVCSYSPNNPTDGCDSGLVCYSSSGASIQTLCEVPPPLEFECRPYDLSPNGLPVLVGEEMRWAYIPVSGRWDSGQAIFEWTGEGGLYDIINIGTNYDTFHRYVAPGTYTARLKITANGFQVEEKDCQISIVVVNSSAPSPTPTPTSGAPGPTRTPTPPSGATATPGGPPTTPTGICGIGQANPANFVSGLFGCGISLVGGIAVLFVIYGGFVFLTSAGDPTKIRVGKEYITYAIVGLLLAIFTLVILQVIGLDILNIPGFGS